MHTIQEHTSQGVLAELVYVQWFSKHPHKMCKIWTWTYGLDVYNVIKYCAEQKTRRALHRMQASLFRWYKNKCPDNMNIIKNITNMNNNNITEAQELIIL